MEHDLKVGQYIDANIIESNILPDKQKKHYSC